MRTRSVLALAFLVLGCKSEASRKAEWAQIDKAKGELNQLLSALRRHRNEAPGECPGAPKLKAKSTSLADVDPWGSPYKTSCSANESAALSFGPDKKEGTEDDIRHVESWKPPPPPEPQPTGDPTPPRRISYRRMSVTEKRVATSAIADLRVVIKRRTASLRQMTEAECTAQQDRQEAEMQAAFKKIGADQLRQKTRYSDHAPYLGQDVERAVRFCLEGCLLEESQEADPDHKVAIETTKRDCRQSLTVLSDLEEAMNAAD